MVTDDAGAKKAAFNPTVNLAPSSAFTATIIGGPNGVRDTTGNLLSANFVWTFTTAPQNEQPSVCSGLDPGNLAINRGCRVQFSSQGFL
ncbi:MAG TPA: Ig-like domain-containing protein [Candidatus Dormibacteraeota bacterium]|nr:Ig-like domain-containing protein [Candidatus Dormibacteraeota bacterium]